MQQSEKKKERKKRKEKTFSQKFNLDCSDSFILSFV